MRAQRTGYNIRRPCVAGGRACVSLVSKSLSNSSLSNSFKKRLQGVGRARSNGCASTGPSAGHELFRLKFAILGHFWPSWSSSFFHNFSNTFFYRFWPHLGSQNGSKILPKSIQNRSKNLIEKLSTLGVDFSSIFDRFWTQLDLKNLQKRCEKYQFSCFC